MAATCQAAATPKAPRPEDQTSLNRDVLATDVCAAVRHISVCDCVCSTAHLLAVSMASTARARPTRRDSRCVPPMPGMTPSVTSGCRAQQGAPPQAAEGSQCTDHFAPTWSLPCIDWPMWTLEGELTTHTAAHVQASGVQLAGLQHAYTLGLAACSKLSTTVRLCSSPVQKMLRMTQ